MGDRSDTHMRESDAFAWYMERDPLLRSTVVAVLVFERCPDLDALTERADRASRVVPGLRHRLVEPPLRLSPPRWTVDPDFDLTYHVRRVRLPAPATFSDLFDFARTAGMAAFDLARPLWEWTLVEGLEGGRAALVLKVHHSLMDGIGGMQLAASLFDVSDAPPDPGPMPEAPAPEHVSTAGLVIDALAYNWDRATELARSRARSALGDLAHALRHPAGTVSEAVRTAQSIARMVRPVTETSSPVMTERKLSWHYDALEMSLDSLRSAAKAVDGTLNDAYLAGLAGGLQRYHEIHGRTVDTLRVTLPISIRRDDDPAGGNRITLMRFPVPTGIDDPAERMRVVHALTSDARSQPSIPLTNAIAGTMNLLPPGLVGGMLKHIDFIASNVPGIPTRLFLGGAKLDRFYPFGPTIGAAVNFTLLSYCGECAVGITTDTGAIPDPGVLVACLADGFAEILALGDGDVTVTVPTAVAVR